MDGTSHLLSLIANIWLCKKIRQRIQNQVVSKQKVGLRPYVMYFISVIILVSFNQVVFHFTQKPNLYQEIQCSRQMSLSQVKAYGDDLKIKIMTIQNMSLQSKMANINKLQNALNILSHPARRLTYDSFGQTDVQFAWAFMNQHFLLQVVLQSAIFYIICTIMSLINSRKSQIKVTLKTQILVMILLFVWEIDLIMTTQNKLHGDYTDFIDKFYFALPMFERREMIKSMLIPAMNMVDIFIVFFVQNSQITKIKELGINPQLRTLTNDVSATIQNDKLDPNNIDQQVGVAIDVAKNRYQFKGQVFRLNRQIIKSLFILNLKTILPTPQIRRINAYFKLPFIQVNQPINQQQVNLQQRQQ